MSLRQAPAIVSELPVDFLFRMEAEVSAPMLVPGAQYGTRTIIAVNGGAFEGPRLRGRVVPGVGGEWATVRGNGTIKADVRLLLETDDGAAIVMTYEGIALSFPADGPDAGNMQIRTAPLFETGAQAYAWLNDVQAVAHGRGMMGEPPAVGYDVYALR